MKAFVVTLTATLLLTSFSVYNAYFKEEPTYRKRLANIAAYVNNQKSATWTAEPPSSDELTKAKAKQLFGQLTRANPKKAQGFTKYPQKPAQQLLKDSLRGSLPPSFDARERWPSCQSIKEVRDQANCGSCWAISAAEVISDRICIASNQKLQPRISTMDMLTCCSDCGDCQGGFNYNAYLYYNTDGVVTGGDHGNKAWCHAYFRPKCNHHNSREKYPKCDKELNTTPACVNQCINQEYYRPYSQDKYFGEKGSVITLSGEDHMMQELVNNGPISVNIQGYEDFLTYKSGIYEHVTGEYLGAHTMKLVGYGEESGVKFWIIANSWNDSWGENGFVRIKKGVNMVEVEGNCNAVTVGV